MATKTLYLLDAHALCYRAFYAVKGLSTSKGQPTNAVYGFVNGLKKIIKDFNPEYFAVCFDKDGKTFRQEKYAEYKIHRPPMPDDLRSQMSLIHDVVKAYRMPMMEVSGYEADDLIATAVKFFGKKDFHVVILSDDKDLFQLVGDHTSVYRPRKNEMLNADGVKSVLGVEPRYVTDFLGMAGDASDNIPGVAGVGKVTAQKLITEFGSLEDIYKSLDQISSKSVRSKMEAQKDNAFLSRELAELRLDAPIANDIEHWRIGEPSAEDLYALFTELEFHRLAVDQKPKETSDSIKTVKLLDFDEMEALILKSKQFAFLSDEETGELVITDGEFVVLLQQKEVKKNAVKIFEDPDILKITYDMKCQHKLLLSSGIECSQGNVFDVMLAGYVLNPARNGHDLSTMLWQYLKSALADDAAMIERVVAVVGLYDPLFEELKKRQVLTLFQDIEMPLARVLALMEMTGVRIDLKLLKKLSIECAEKLSTLEGEIYKISGEEFNINSPKQLSHVLFEKLELPVIKKTKTGFSTNEEVLHKLALQHELPQKILDFRQLTKLKSTYIDALPELTVGANKDEIHASFNQTVTETGRLSSSNPNLQNIPIRTDLGKRIRRAFIPLNDEHLLLSSDYSQIELRILADLSGDENLIKAFDEGEDIHAFTAGLMFDVEIVDVTDEMRTAAKRVNFGIIYGISSFGLAKDLNVSFAQAQDFIDRYFLRYPKVKAFMDQAIEDCRNKGYAETLMNRRRDIPEINSNNANIRQFAERQAINTPVQGSAADLIKLAMVRVQRRLEKENLKSRMMITVHDEIVFDLVPSEKKTLIELVVDEMESAMALVVPITVSVKVGKNWLDMEKVEVGKCEGVKA